MALKDKIEEVKVEEEVIKLTQDELQKLGNLLKADQYITTELGTIKRLEYQVKERTEAVETLLQDQKTETTRFYRDIEEKYGQGSVDINTGIFTPVKRG